MARRRISLAAGAFGLAALAAPFAALRAQTARPMTLVDLMNVPRLLDPQLAPDGRALIYTIASADWTADRRVPHVWRQEIGGAPLQLTFGDAGETFARWSPDGKSILFLTRRGNDAETQVFVMPADGGEAREVTHHASSVSSPAWSPDGAAIYFVAPDPRTTEERDRDRLKDDVYAFEETAKQRHLWRVVVATGAEQKITSGEASVTGFRVSRDGRRIALERAPTPLSGDSWRAEVWLMDADGGNARVLTDNSIEESEAELSPDGTAVLFLAEANARFEPYYNSMAFVEPAGGGAARPLLPEDFPYEIAHASWAPDGRSILAVVNMGVHSEIFSIDLTGHAVPITDGRHSVQFWSLAPAAKTMVFQLDEPTRLGDVWTLPVPAGAPAVSTPTRVTGLYDAYQRDFALPREEKIEWKGADGTPIEGVLFYPLDYQAGARYPLVVQAHGGPRESDKFGLGPAVINDYVPVLTARGYAVLKPNYRGSTGYGNAFLRDMVGGYFRNAHLDVMAGVDALVREGIADPDRLVIMGWSAGGHMTNKLITFTDRFKAASAGAGASDWVSLYAQTDSRAWRTAWFGGTPWQKNAPIDVYWANSPLKDVAAARTPTLFFVGEQDATVPLPQSVEMYRALKSNGVATHLYVAPREGHVWGGLHHQLFKANAELEWFERHVRNRAYVWEKRTQ